MFHVVEICPCSPEVCFCPLLFGPTLAAHLQSKHPSCKTWPICTYPWTMEQRMVDGWKDWLDQILVTSAIITCHNALLLFIIFVPFPRLHGCSVNNHRGFLVYVEYICCGHFQLCIPQSLPQTSLPPNVQFPNLS